ncbi:MAG: hypothetical protein H6728_14190 [Myxococcales bacterium]|nr:hypothetical protein [Myxococcales bacterium]
MATYCVLSTLGDDPHTQGLFRIRRMIEKAGIQCNVLPPGASNEAIFDTIHQQDPSFLGFSYRLSPEVGVKLFRGLLEQLDQRGLLKQRQGESFRRVALAGLPETMNALQDAASTLPCPIWTMAQDNDRLRGASRVLDFFAVHGEPRDLILSDLSAEWFPPRIELLDELAKQVVKDDVYREEPPLAVPSQGARRSYVQRIQESPLPVLRVHFGVPHTDIRPTVEGIKRIAEERVIDEISIGSSDLSQRYYGKPHEFASRKNDGGVPYKDFSDLVAMAEAAQCGNFPSLKPYAHVVDLVGFVQECLKAGMLVGAHQAVPLYWFNELDGRGPMTVPASIEEHIAAIRELVKHGIPTEMNDPNQWSSRWVHDAVFCADYALISAVMSEAGSRDLVLQMQFNKPRETSDFADLAKMTAGLELAKRVISFEPQRPKIWRETRTGIDSLDPDPAIAKWQLARSTLLQMMVRPNIIHQVSYCEADHIATTEDVIDSSKLVRRAVRVFRQHEAELLPYLQHPHVVERKNFLLQEASYLLTEIAALSRHAPPSLKTNAPVESLTPYLADPHALSRAIERGYMAAPGIFHARYQVQHLVTGPNRLGGMDCLNPQTFEQMSERERIARLKDHRANNEPLPSVAA